jgi:predicted amidophosphoribosyltransferase
MELTPFRCHACDLPARLSTLPWCELCAQVLIVAGAQPASEPFESITAGYYNVGLATRVLKRWKTARGLLLDRKVLIPDLLHPLPPVDAIIPIPQEVARSWVLQGSPALHLSQWISREKGVPVQECLRWGPAALHPIPQAQRHGEERWIPQRPLHMSGSAGGLPPLFDRSVLLVDDFYTTGTTLRSAALALQHCGVRAVHVFCLGIGKESPHLLESGSGSRSV